MSIIIIPTTLLQIFYKIIIILEVIFKSIIDPDDNFCMMVLSINGLSPSHLALASCHYYKGHVHMKFYDKLKMIGENILVKDIDCVRIKYFIIELLDI